MKEKILSIMMFFRQSAKLLSSKNQTFLGGNLDPFYAIAPFYLIKNFRNKAKMISFLKILSILVIISIIQLIFIEDLSYLKFFVNIAKITICILIMLYSYENSNKINYIKVVRYFSIFLLILTVGALILSDNDILWRFNDGVNKYTLTRMQLLFLEPSELGYHIGIISIFAIGIFLKNFNEKNYYLLRELSFYILINLFSLYLARPMGAICILAFSLTVMILFDYIYHPSYVKKRVYLCIVMIGIIVVAGLFFIKSPIAMRIFEAFNGNDGSISYRLGISLDVTRLSFKDFHMIGCGLGQINTPSFIANYESLGLTTVVVNSFLYFIIEGGILALFVVLSLIIYLLMNCLKSKSPLKISIFTFLIIYQFVGSHFTSGLNWALYGFIIAGSNYKKVLGD